MQRENERWEVPMQVMGSASDWRSMNGDGSASDIDWVNSGRHRHLRQCLHFAFLY
jgi:hypothetical protein